MKRCIQADLDDAGAFRRNNENNSERPVCIVHAPAQLVFFWVNMHHVRVFVFVSASDIEWAMNRAPVSTRPEIPRCGLACTVLSCYTGTVEYHCQRSRAARTTLCCGVRAAARHCPRMIGDTGCDSSKDPIPAVSTNRRENTYIRLR